MNAHPLKRHIHFDEERPGELWDEFCRLPEMNPRHFALVSAANAYCWWNFGEPLVITDIYRPEHPGSVHGAWRGTDCRMFHPDRVVQHIGLDDHQGYELCEYLNSTFEYKRTDGSESVVALIHGDTLNRHLHLQTPVGKLWRA